MRWIERIACRVEMSLALLHRNREQGSKNVGVDAALRNGRLTPKVPQWHSLTPLTCLRQEIYRVWRTMNCLPNWPAIFFSLFQFWSSYSSLKLSSEMLWSHSGWLSYFSSPWLWNKQQFSFLPWNTVLVIYLSIYFHISSAVIVTGHFYHNQCTHFGLIRR